MPFQVTQRSIKDMIHDGKIDIPIHQRPYIWTPNQAEGFLITIMDGMPTLSLILYEEVVNGKIIRWLEDGQQRFITIKRFHNGEFGDKVKWNNHRFTDFTPEEKVQFETYALTITTMEDVPCERRLALFQAIQDGTPLTNGQRFNAYSHSPVVKLANAIMRDPRCIVVWGECKDDNKKGNLANAVAIASGVAFDNIDAITTSYDILGKNGFLDTTFDENDKLDKLISVYERADELSPTSVSKKKSQWNVGKYTGYILYSMCIPNRDWKTDKEMFAQFISRVRKDERKMEILTYMKPSTRNWNEGRWKQGLKNLDNQDEVSQCIEKMKLTQTIAK